MSSGSPATLPQVLACAVGALLLSGPALADVDYLSAAQVPNGIAILPPPPGPSSAAAQADSAIFYSTRHLLGSARWKIATEDVENSPFDRYACALDLKLSPATAPKLAQLLDRAGTGAFVDAVKRHYQARRPFVGTAEPICEPKTDHLIANGDYPSGHAANGWLEALILAALVPARSMEVLARGRAYGENRVVCGSHNLSAVEGGWLAGSAMFAVLMAEPKFQGDLEAARRELAELGATAERPNPARCEMERSALAARPW